MPRGKTTSPYQEKQVIDLYQRGDVSISDILKQTGIRYSQTLYRILDDHNIPRRPRLNDCVAKTFYIEKDVAAILSQQPNASRYVNDAIRYFHESDKNK